eukprot:scaffold1689_cov305-Prasinococcus_capsulatus_cf.AAC.3
MRGDLPCLAIGAHRPIVVFEEHVRFRQGHERLEFALVEFCCARTSLLDTLSILGTQKRGAQAFC